MTSGTKVTPQPNATWKQASRIWGFVQDTDENQENVNWAELAKTGKLSKADASLIIGLIHRVENLEPNQSMSGRYRTSLETSLQLHFQNYLMSYDRLTEHNATYKGKTKDTDQEQESPKEKTDHHKGPFKNDPKTEETPPKEPSTEVDDLLAKLKDALTEKQEPVPAIPDIKTAVGYTKPEIFDEVSAFVNSGINVLLTGPAGCGKSRMIKEIADSMETPFFTLSLSGGMRYAQVFGGTQIQENGSSAWVPSQLLNAVQDAGIVLLDEIFAADHNIAIGLNSLLEPDTRSITTPIGQINVHEDCRFVGAANTVGRSVSRQYTGATRCDDSLLDRFLTVPMDYSTKVESKILSRALPETGDRKWFKSTIKSLRSQVKQHNIPFDPSTRRLINSVKAFGCGVTRERAFEVAFLSGMSTAERGKINLDTAKEEVAI